MSHNRCCTLADPESLGMKEKQSEVETESIAEVMAEKSRKKRSIKQQIGRRLKVGVSEKLTISQLQDIAKKRGVSIYRNKEDFIRMLALLIIRNPLLQPSIPLKLQGKKTLSFMHSN